MGKKEDILLQVPNLLIDYSEILTDRLLLKVPNLLGKNSTPTIRSNEPQPKKYVSTFHFSSTI